MTHRIVWRPAARLDLLSLYDWIADQADADIALDYTARIEARAAKLLDAPPQGTPRDDIMIGLRTVTYRRRTTIAYRVDGGRIEIIRLAHGGRDLGRLFEDDEELI